MLEIIFAILSVTVISIVSTLLYRCVKTKDNMEQEIRAALLNQEELEKHGRELALIHAVSARRSSSRKLLPRMDDNYRFIIKAYKELNADVAGRKSVAPAAEWLFDNFYVIEEQVKGIRINFPKGYYAALPTLLGGSFKGYPRIYGLALELVSHTDGRIDEKLLKSFMKSYQSKSQLTSGELWAVPIMLRIALIENIRNVCEDILKSQQQKREADTLADIILLKEGEDPEKIMDIIISFTRDMEFLSPYFAERLLQRIRRHGADTGIVMHCIDEKLAFQDTNAEDIIQIEHQEQAQNQISMGNSITSLRLISTLEWNEIFEELSPVEQALRSDPADIYRLMDFESRDFYRHEIEDMARHLRIAESLVAKKAVECALKQTDDGDLRGKHVGCYIMGKGRDKLESVIGYKPGPAARFKRFIKSHPTKAYLWSITVITGSAAGILTTYAYNFSTNPAMAVMTGFVVLLPAWELGVGIVNWTATHILSPSFLPKLELKEGIPEENASMVVVPTLLPNCERVKSLFEQLEVYYLANQERNLFFAILGDYTDARQKDMPEDDKIVGAALDEVKRLNKKYSEGGKELFFFFHRYRKYNPSQDMWMGWERKRGKLVEFNNLLRDSQDTTYYIKSGDISEIPKVKYIITLDADTELPRGAAKKLVGTISHPLNRAVMDEKRCRVTDGYGILQPRISIGVMNANKSLFSRIFAGQGGIDPYTTAVSDVYQDLFGEGIYTGKGIYDIDVFQTMLDGYIPENSVLSHDLLEGSYTRAGLVTDIELVDGFPARYNSYAARMHRWVRGDWQLLPWLMPRVRDSNGQYVKSPLSLISKWKILDNLRRSLTPPSLMLLIFMGLIYLPGDILVWVGFTVITVALPILTDMADAVISRSRARGSNYSTPSNFKNILYQILLMVILLPYRSYLMMDAIIRTLVRLSLTKKNLLEWETAADAEARLKSDTRSFFTRMWVSPVSSALLLGLTLGFSPKSWPAALVFVVLWIISPSAAYWISRVDEETKALPGSRDIRELRHISRKTWRYFEEFAGPVDNYLPPDNYQEEPPNGIAHRTSPTNIGLLLASILCARDFGYINTTGLIDRVEKTLSSMEKLDRWKGHFYNWYDTRTLQPLRPLYVSTVDSGNFVGYLMVLIQGIREYAEKPLMDKSLKHGLRDTMDMLDDAVKEEYKDVFMGLKTMVENSSDEPWAWYDTLKNIKEKIKEIKDGGGFEYSPWYDKVYGMADSFEKELSTTMPWMQVLSGMPENLKNGEEGFEEISARVGELTAKLGSKLSLPDLSVSYKYGMAELNDIILSLEARDGESAAWLRDLKASLMSGYLAVNRLLSTCKVIMEKYGHIVDGTEFKPLFDERRQLFSIGYSIEEEQLNRSYYDLLASEARQTSFIAIAKGDIGQKHWFRLGRPLTILDRYKGLVSWSGTMFEYLMPLLLMKNYKNTLMDETYNFVIRCQKTYGSMRRVPWGVSECGYNGFDISFNYQYRAFGIPRLGLKRGLVNDIVVAPYATILALMVDHVSSMKNLKALRDEGLEGEYGYYEAIDYTPGRVPVDRKGAIVKSYMVHHHGMSLLALNNVLNGGIMQERFHSDPSIKATELLLQEKVPGRIILTKDIEEEITPVEKIRKTGEEYSKIVREPVLPFPESHIISNGSYSVVLTNSGSGYSRKGDTSITRWREDTSLDNHGMFFYIQNINSNMVWSAAYEPSRVIAEEYKVVFSSDKIEYMRVDGSIDTHTEIVVSPEDNGEVRRISLTNHSDHSRVIEVTSYFETVISQQSADVSHPAFNKLFVRTEFEKDCDSLLAARRPRTPQDKEVWLMHTVTVEGETVGGVQYETDRAKFIGRNRSIVSPAALDVDHPLSNTVGPVLDPVMSLRRRVRIKPGETVRLSYTTGIADAREKAVEMARKYHDPSSVERAFELAWTRSQVEQSYLNLKNSEMETYRKMLSHILYLSPLRRLREDMIKSNVKGQSGLWPHGISGDIPIILVALSKSDEVDLVYEALKAHEYLRARGFAADLVILNEDIGSYLQALQGTLNDIVSSSHAREIQNRPGGAFLRQANTMTLEERTLLYSTARIVLKGEGGSIAKQLKARVDDRKLPEQRIFKGSPHVYPVSRGPMEELLYYNGMGGFKKDGKEYVIYLDEDRHTPAPWVNVICNKDFGCLVTENGLGYTWAENSREFKLTPWSNDPVIDLPGEIVYLRDEEDGAVWSITPGPIRENENYTIRHGFGYSVFQHGSHGIKQEMTVFVPQKEKIKIIRVKLKNMSGKARHILAVYYIRPVLGVSDQITSPFIVTEVHENTGVMLVKNTYSDDFPGRIAFVDCSMEERSVTGDRIEFIGRGRNLSCPGVMNHQNLSGRVGAGYDPCSAMEVKVDLGEGEEKELVFTLGEDVNLEDGIATALKYRSIEEVEKSYRNIRGYWNSKLGEIQVDTPDMSLNIMMNGWLLYQTIASRLRARSAFYQSGGAYGFRDQLQDVMAVSYISPDTTRNQILYSSFHQFLEGDVQHWWHPVTDRGIRTKFSDDLLWLPYVTADYMDITKDYGILEEKAGFLEDEPLGEEEDERYNKPRISDYSDTIYEHCIRAIDRSLKLGPHGIPLIGSGDWNDGMSTVGNKGKGESIWLGWFLYTILNKFAPICKERGDTERSERYLSAGAEIAANIEKNGWDGSWYRRAYFDNGVPLGSASNTECQIDSLAQSWAVISGGGKQYRILEAMRALEQYLIKKDEGIILLLTPPFDKSDLEPGYIKGYVPGVRENGGQYTHAATWVILSFAMLGDGNKAWKLFNMINPINHSSTPMEAARYKVEPYVMAADVYAVEPHMGRGGWTWYTGTSGWMYRVCIEYILGLKIRGDSLIVDPCIPKDWSGYNMKYRYKNTSYIINIKNPYSVNTGVKKVHIDGKLLDDNRVPLLDDGGEHHVDVQM